MKLLSSACLSAPEISQLTGLASRLALFIGLCSLNSCATRPFQDPPPAASAAYFTQEVKPILELNCLKCHNSAILPGALDLSSRAAALSFQHHGKKAIVPGRPESSLLLQAVARSGAHDKAMPPVYLSLTPEQIETLNVWIAAGATWPEGRAGKLRPRCNPENPYAPAEAIDDIRSLKRHASL